MYLHFHKLIVGSLACPVTGQPSVQQPLHLLYRMYSSCMPFCRHQLRSHLQLYSITFSVSPDPFEVEQIMHQYHQSMQAVAAIVLQVVEESWLTCHSWSLPVFLCEQFLFIKELIIVIVCRKGPACLLRLLRWLQGD